MNRALSRSSAAASAAFAVLARVFYGLMVEEPYVQGGAWLSVLLGLLLSLPVFWLMGRRRGPAARALPLFLLLDAASAMACAGYTASSLAFTHVPMLLLMLPLALAAARCACLGGDALGASARLWLWALAALMLVVVIFQLPYYRPAWIFPLLGEGVGSVLWASLRVAGWISTLAGAAIRLCEPPPRLPRVVASVSLAAGVAAALILLRLMMTPPGDYLRLSRFVRVDSLLTNGLVIWFMAMLHLLCYEVWACAALLPRAGNGLFIVAVPAAACLLAILHVNEIPALSLIANLRFPVLAALSFIGREARGHA